MNSRLRTAIALVTVTVVTSIGALAHADEPTEGTTPPVETQAPEPPPPEVTVSVTVEDEPTTTVGITTTTDTEVSDEEGVSGSSTVPPSQVSSSLPGQVQNQNPDPDEDEASSDATPSASSSTSLAPNGHIADQETVATGTQVANANSGGNAVENDAPGTSVALGTSVETGGASAIGSQDENIVSQTADVVLTEQAVANLLQLALIINVGVALANSGINGVTSTPNGDGTSGSIGTGNANALGNSIGQYITQGASGNATQDLDDNDSQLAISLFLGLATANSGVNSVSGTGVAGSGGAVGTGSAGAIGNDSLTNVNQQAYLQGSGTSTLNVAQRAAVLNLGFALANSGLNDISGAAGALLAASSDEDDAIAEQLFTMLLPALLQANGYGVGSGLVGTGDASAIGNQSQTFIKQIAMAVASGDGISSIAQDVIVANMGAAGANTGGNQIGRSIADLDPHTAETVVALAAFLSAMLAQVQGFMNGQAMALDAKGMDIPFGNLVLQIGGSLSAFDTDVSDVSGAKAHIRQVTIVLSLGMAQANTGGNAVITEQVADTPALARASAIRSLQQARVNAEAVPADSLNNIATGFVDAGNDNLVVICQKIDMDSLECLRPPDPPPPPPPGDDPEDPTTTTTTPTMTLPPFTVVEIPTLWPDEPVDGGEVPVTPPTGTNPQQPIGIIHTPIGDPPDCMCQAVDLAQTGINVQMILIVALTMCYFGALLIGVQRKAFRRGVVDQPPQ